MSHSARAERDEQAAVLVVGGEEVGDDLLLPSGPRPEAQALAEATHAPLERELCGVALGLESAQPEALDDVRPEQVLFAVPRQLEDPAAACENPRLRVADDEACVRRRVVVVHQLEQEAEAAAL